MHKKFVALVACTANMIPGVHKTLAALVASTTPGGHKKLAVLVMHTASKTPGVEPG